MTELLLMTFYDFLIRHFKKNVQSHVFLKSKKRKIGYVFSNTAGNVAPLVIVLRDCRILSPLTVVVACE